MSTDEILLAAELRRQNVLVAMGPTDGSYDIVGCVGAFGAGEPYSVVYVEYFGEFSTQSHFERLVPWSTVEQAHAEQAAEKAEQNQEAHERSAMKREDAMSKQQNGVRSQVEQRTSYSVRAGAQLRARNAYW